MGCVRFSRDQPFVYASGLKGPIYCDNRLSLGFPRQRKEIVRRLVDRVGEIGLSFESIAAVATGGVPYAAMMAHEMDASLIYVRNKRKEHGREGRIEGFFREGSRTLLVEDLVNQGTSVSGAIIALRRAGLVVDTCLAIVDYAMPKAQKALKDLEVALSSLTDFPSLLAEMSLPKEVRESALSWHEDPEAWGRRL